MKRVMILAFLSMNAFQPCQATQLALANHGSAVTDTVPNLFSDGPYWGNGGLNSPANSYSSWNPEDVSSFMVTPPQTSQSNGGIVVDEYTVAPAGDSGASLATVDTPYKGYQQTIDFLKAPYHGNMVAPPAQQKADISSEVPAQVSSKGYQQTIDFLKAPYHGNMVAPPAQQKAEASSEVPAQVSSKGYEKAMDFNEPRDMFSSTGRRSNESIRRDSGDPFSRDMKMMAASALAGSGATYALMRNKKDDQVPNQDPQNQEVPNQDPQNQEVPNPYPRDSDQQQGGSS